jgi:hypothetical protein
MWGEVQAESIERFIDDHAFSPSYDLAPPPPPSTSSTGNTQEDRQLRNRENMLMGEEAGGGKEPNHTTARKPGPL